MAEKEYYSMETIKDTIMEYIGEQTVSKYPSSAECNAARKGAEGVIYALEDAPAADVVEVVRCKDCRHYKPNQYDPDGEMVCKYWSVWEYTDPGEFCNHGERKG